MESDKDAYGKFLLAELKAGSPSAEIIERDDGYVDLGSENGLYFTKYEDWPEAEQKAIAHAAGRVLDIGCGAGRHSLYLQEKGFDVTGIDNAPGAIEVCRARGLKKALVRPIGEIGSFETGSFGTILMLGNNFGLFGTPLNAVRLLGEMDRITTPDAHIIAGTVDPYDTDNEAHLRYHKLNRKRGRPAGQITMRIRYGDATSDWFDYLFVSHAELEEILAPGVWRVSEYIESGKAVYYAIIEKKS